MKGLSRKELEIQIDTLEARLEESEQLINAIKAGEVDAFAIHNNRQSEIYTLQSGDYAYRILVENFEEGALNVTEEGLIVYTNEYFCQLIETSYDKVIGAQISDFIHSESLAIFEQAFLKSIAHSWKGEINLKKGGTFIPVLLSLTSLQPNLPTVGIIITDYTEKKKNENLILEYQKSLIHRNEELKLMNSELESFVYIASHDLQEPLRKIQTFASLIKDNEAKSLTRTALKYFTRMESAAARMQNLIRDLLAYSRTNDLDKTFVECDLLRLLEEVRSEMEEELIATNAVIEVKEMCQAEIIPFQIKQLLINLIGNSLKFSNAEKSPHILINSKIVRANKIAGISKPDETPYCHLEIKDNGIGFQPEFAEKMFELFQRIHGKTHYSGTGIGLAIVKKIVDNHKGIVRASSIPERGATFNVFLPQYHN